MTAVEERAQTTADPAAARRAVAAAAFGTALEWYDFFLYGTAAALVFPALFFPAEDPATGLLLSFAVFATGFVARPLGGLVAGHLGDRFGRRDTLTATLVTMGVASALIGMLPTYAAIGVAAPLLLVALRFVQGLAAGGEWTGAAILTFEQSRTGAGGRGGFVSSGIYVGLIGGNLAFTVLTAALDEQAFLAWGWRVPFLASLVLVAVGVVLRRRVPETPAFAAASRTRRPIVEALLRMPRSILAVFLVRVGQNVSFYVISVFCLSYATVVVGLPRWMPLTALLVGSGIAAVLCPWWGRLGDRVGRARLTIAGLTGLAVLAVPLFAAFDSGSGVLIVAVAALALGIANAAVDGVQPAWFSSLFPVRARYSGISVGREAAGIVGGGLSPLIAAALVAATGSWWPVAALMIVAALLGIAGAALGRTPAPATTVG